MSRPWMPLYVADYLADTGHLSTVEHGAYMLLIMHYWANGGLPADDRKLARIARMPEAEWAGIRETLADLFAEGWQHKRIDAELAKADDVSSKRKAAAERRHSNSSANAPAIAVQLDTQSQSQSHTQLEPLTSEAIASSVVERASAPPALENPSADIAEAFRAYNAVADQSKWPGAQRLTQTRRAALAARLRECGGLDGWREALARAERSDFLCGRIPRDGPHANWTFDLDCLLQQKTFTRLMEGRYDNRTGPPADDRPQWLRALGEVAQRRDALERRQADPAAGSDPFGEAGDRGDGGGYPPALVAFGR